MNRIVVKSKVGSDGVLHLEVPVGKEAADKEVRVTVEFRWAAQSNRR